MKQDRLILEDRNAAIEMYNELRETRSTWKDDPDICLYYAMLKAILGIPMSLSEIGIIPSINLTRERVRQVQQKAFHKIQRAYTLDEATLEMIPRSKNKKRLKPSLI